jgi:hypothetical protein
MPDQIQRKLLLDAPAEAVWGAVTGGDWLADEVELELWPGGEATFRSPDECRTGWVEEVLAPDAAGGRMARLAFWWAVDGEPATRVELTIEALDEDLTHLTVIETRPLDLLDLVGTPLHGADGSTFGPALLAVAC